MKNKCKIGSKIKYYAPFGKIKTAKVIKKLKGGKCLIKVRGKEPRVIHEDWLK